MELGGIKGNEAIIIRSNIERLRLSLYKLISFQKWSEGKHAENQNFFNKTVYSQVLRIIKNELTPQQEKIVMLVMHGVRQEEISRNLGIDISSASRTYKRGMENVRRFAKYLEPFLF